MSPKRGMIKAKKASVAVNTEKKAPLPPEQREKDPLGFELTIHKTGIAEIKIDGELIGIHYGVAKALQKIVDRLDRLENR